MKQQNSKQIKSFICSFIKTLSFLLIFALLLEIISVTVFSKKAATQYQNSFSKSCSFTTEPKNSIDIALIGSSNLYSGFIPAQLWDEYGYTSTVISTPKQTVQRSQAFLDELLKVQNPKLLVIETDMFYADVPLDNDSDFSHGKPKRKPSTAKIKKAIKLISSFPVGENLENHFTVFMFHDTWKTLKRNTIQEAFKRTDNVTCEHGYNFNKIVYPTKDNDRMNFTDERLAIPDENIIYINKMIESCKQRGIKVMFAEMPSTTSWNYARYNAVKDFADANDIPFVDLNLIENFNNAGIKYDSDYRDDGNHLNYYGAVKATKFLSKAVSDTYSDILSDKRSDPQFSYWQKSSDEFKEKYNIS